MSNKPKVSIIILTYNNLKLVKKALESVYSQEYDNIEVLVADDHSSEFDFEQVQSIVDLYGKQKETIIYSNEINLGTVRNFNNAIRKSTGELIFPLACDDEFVDSAVIGDLVNYFSHNDVQVCAAKREGEITKAIFPIKEDIDILLSPEYDKDILNRLSVDNFLSGSTLYYRRSYLEKVGMFDERYKLLEDYPFVYKMAVNGDRIGWFDRITIIYGEDGISSPKKWGQNKILTKDFDDFFENEVIANINSISSLRCRRYLKYIYGRRTFSLFKRICNNFIYIDIVLTKIIYKFSKKERSIFWFLV